MYKWEVPLGDGFLFISWNNDKFVLLLFGHAVHNYEEIVYDRAQRSDTNKDAPNCWVSNVIIEIAHTVNY